MLADLDADEMADWEAFYRLEPVGPERDDINAAGIVSMIANTNRDPKRRPDPFTPSDFLPFAEPPKKAPLGQRLKDAFARIKG